MTVEKSVCSCSSSRRFYCESITCQGVENFTGEQKEKHCPTSGRLQACAPSIFLALLCPLPRFSSVTCHTSWNVIKIAPNTKTEEVQCVF